jgi:hypothetical protein
LTDARQLLESECIGCATAGGSAQRRRKKKKMQRRLAHSNLIVIIWEFICEIFEVGRYAEKQLVAAWVIT